MTVHEILTHTSDYMPISIVREKDIFLDKRERYNVVVPFEGFKSVPIEYYALEVKEWFIHDFEVSIVI